MATKSEITENAIHRNSNIVARFNGGGETVQSLAAEFDLHAASVYKILKAAGCHFARSKADTSNARERAIKLLRKRHAWGVDSLAVAFGVTLEEMSGILVAIDQTVE